MGVFRGTSVRMMCLNCPTCTTFAVRWGTAGSPPRLDATRVVASWRNSDRVSMIVQVLTSSASFAFMSICMISLLNLYCTFRFPLLRAQYAALRRLELRVPDYQENHTDRESQRVMNADRIRAQRSKEFIYCSPFARRQCGT